MTKDIEYPNQIARWRAENPERQKESAKVQRARYRGHLRVQILTHYGGKCNCCGEADWHFLTIEHIGGVPDCHRHQRGKHKGKRLPTEAIMAKIVKDQFPEYIEILCWNCNAARSLYGQCPHQADQPLRYHDGKMILPELAPRPRKRPTHCKRGHRFTYRSPSTGQQVCTICHSAARKRRKNKALGHP